MKRFVKFGAILMALAVAFVSCRGGNGGGQKVNEITVNVGITDGTTELKAPVAIKGVDFNAIKAKFVEKFDLTALGSEYLFIAGSDSKIYTVDLGTFFSDVATATQVQAADVKAGNKIYLKATAKTVNVTFAITDGTTSLKHTSVSISKLDFNAVAMTVATELEINLNLLGGGVPTVTINGDTYTVAIDKLYSDVNATQEVNQDNAVEVVASGATIYLKATKNN